MLNESRLIGFVSTTDAARSREFYEGKLGLQFVGDDAFALVLRAGANMVRIGKAKEHTPAPHTVLGWEVQNIESLVAWLTARGVAFEKYPFAQDRQTGIWTAPSGDKVAWFKDPDGNVLSVSQHQ